ncbi:unnamed protein product [Cochlearia groenlandica]
MMRTEYPACVSRIYIAIYETIENPLYDSIISWGKTNKSFVIWDFEALHTIPCIHRIYRKDLSKLLRILDNHGFVRVKKNKEQMEFGHKKYFVRGKPELLEKLQSYACLVRAKRNRALRSQERQARNLELNKLQNLHI